MTKRILFFTAIFTLFFSTASHAKVLDAIAMIVEGEAVTTAEISALQQQAGISKEEAREMLIQDRLQKVSMQDILVDESKIDARIASIAKQNSLTVKKMRSIIKEEGTSWVDYRQQIRNSMQKEKFIQEKVLKEPLSPSEEQLKAFYEVHKAEFEQPGAVNVIAYSTPDQPKMQQFLASGQGLQGQKQTLQAKEISPGLLSILMQTADNSFTQPFNAGDRYVIYQVLSRSSGSAASFESVKNMVTQKWFVEEQEKQLKDYFEKLRNNAQIDIIRK